MTEPAKLSPLLMPKKKTGFQPKKPDLTINWEQKMKELTHAEKRKLAKIFKEMKKTASEDPIYFFDNFLRIYNPTKSPTDIPFKTFDYQKRIIRDVIQAMRDGEDLFIDKAREMGMSYVMMGTILWLWLFEPGFTALVGSRKQDLVDNRKGGVIGSKDASLFSKLGYMLERLPPFMLPEGFKPERHFLFLSLINPENGNAVTGESSNSSFGRGGRYKLILLDEFAFFENAYSVWGATKASVPHGTRVVVTTPGEKPGKAKRLRFGDDGEAIKIIEVPHHLHPEKTSSWLKKQRSEYSEEDFNREIMMDWGLSIKGRIYPELDNADVGKYPFIPNQQLYVSGDYGLDGTVFCFWQINPANGKPRLIDSFSHMEQPIEYYFPLFRKPPDSAFEYSEEQLKAFDEISKLPPAIHFGDPSVNKRSGNKEMQSDRDRLASIGCYVHTYTKDNSINYRVKTTKSFLKNGIEINENERNNTSFDLMKQYRWKTWDEENDSTSTFRKPVHNMASHFGTCLEYFAVNMMNETHYAPQQAPREVSSSFITSRKMLRKHI